MSYFGGDFDVIVVGAGHAGCEAALASARMGLNTLVFTISLDNIALMPCNPSIGGPAKGHLVREIDALGGEMGRNIDKTYIQIKMLNTSKGPAVHALRAQADKKGYQKEMYKTMSKEENLTVRQGVVEEIIVENGEIKGVKIQTGGIFNAKAVVITAGTYMDSRIIIGDFILKSGPQGFLTTDGLSKSLRENGVELLRLKTGTPARVNADTLDYTKMSIQPGSEEGFYFSFENSEREKAEMNVPCWLTYTNTETHQVIRNNLDRSPLFSGVIQGTGPRYCPSIEDKVVRFATKDQHQIFIEPEGSDTNEIYVQGMNTSLPEEVQLEMLRTIKGLENVEILRTGYAIEYDAVRPSQLKLSFELKNISGLFTAGQINGTSGYEEAAAQGLLAGINAALKVLDKEPFILSRAEAYLGVLIDDLITKETTEPYRLLTSRSEHRLFLRQDNADLRLTSKGHSLGLISNERHQRFIEKKENISREIKMLKEEKIAPSNEKLRNLISEKGTPDFKQSVSLYEIIKRNEINYEDLITHELIEGVMNKEIQEQINIQVKYEGYIDKQLKQIEKFNKLENKTLSEKIDYSQIFGLRKEAAQKLDKIKPVSVGQASRIQGVSPADIAVLMVYLEKNRRIQHD